MDMEGGLCVISVCGCVCGGKWVCWGECVWMGCVCYQKERMKKEEMKMRSRKRGEKKKRGSRRRWKAKKKIRD